MKIRLSLLISLLSFSAAFGRAEDVAPTPTATAKSAESPADRDYAAYEALQKTPRPKPAGAKLTAVEYYTWMDATLQKVGTAGLAFFENYPNDARRWEIAAAIVNQPPLFAKEIGPDIETKGPGAIVVDEPAKAAWAAKLEAVRKAMETSPDVPAPIREGMEWGMFAKDFRASSAALKAGQTVDWSVFRARFDAHVAKYPDLDLSNRANDYLGALDRNVPGAAQAEWTYLQQKSSSDALRKAATAKLSHDEMMKKPIEMKFVAVDGREVDLAKLRGKVVLVDFWATWCGPCVAELPNVKKVYAAYHDQGFEVIGISLENGKLAPGDTPERTEAKLAAAKKILTDFTAKEGMAWPQYFDGKWWKNELAVPFGINAIPAMLLLDQEGKVVATDARGPKLEAEVKRLLKL